MLNYCLLCERKTWIDGELCSACQRMEETYQETGVIISYATEEETELLEMLNLER